MQTRIIERALWAAAAVLAAGVAQAAGVPGQGTWETTLLPRDLNGDRVADAFYDTALDITWLRNANVNGAMNWNSANTWAVGLDVYGVKGWRLPTMVDTESPGCNFSYAGGTDCGFNVQTATSEMAHLWYVALGNKSYCDPALSTGSFCSGPQPGWGLTNTGDFQNMQAGYHWSGLEYAQSAGYAWAFSTFVGSQIGDYAFNSMYALAVRPGDVPVVPEPQTYALLLAGLTALAVLRRRPR